MSRRARQRASIPSLISLALAAVLACSDPHAPATETTASSADSVSHVDGPGLVVLGSAPDGEYRMGRGVPPDPQGQDRETGPDDT
jgi:hypothetical protein